MKLQQFRDRIDIDSLSILSRFLLVLFSGGITILAFPHEGAYSLLSWVCMVPWLLSLHKAKWWERICYGFLYGTLYIVPGQFGGIWSAIENKDWSQNLSVFLIVLFFSCYIIPFIVFSCIKPWFIQHKNLSVIRLSIIFTCLIVWFPTYFPVTPACMIHDQPLMYQTADFGGLAVVIFTVLFVNLSIAELILQFNHKDIFFFHALCLVIYILLVVGYGYIRITQFEYQKKISNGKSIDIIAIQTRIRPVESMSSLLRQNSTQKFSALEWSAYAIQTYPKAGLIVLPESSVDTIDEQNRNTLINTLSAFSKEHQKNILFSYAEPKADVSPSMYYNTSQLMIHNGTMGVKYQKKILTPFYEYNPIQHIIPMEGYHYFPGTENAVIPFENITLIPAICYEIHSASHIRFSVLAGGNIIIHAGNFMTFGKGTIGYIDLTMSRLRAVENRVPIVRSCNWGYGAFIDATGRIIPNSLNSPTKRNAYSFPLFIPNQRAPYTYIGNLFLYLLTLLVSADLLWSYKVRKTANNNLQTH